MQLINRDCLVLRAKQAFADWARSVPGLEMPDASLDDVNLEATVLLVPEGFSEEDAIRYIARLKPILARKLFAAWYLDESTWPDFDELPFDHWIAVEYHSMVYDMAVGVSIVKDEEDELDSENQRS